MYFICFSHQKQSVHLRILRSHCQSNLITEGDSLILGLAQHKYKSRSGTRVSHTIRGMYKFHKMTKKINLTNSEVSNIISISMEVALSLFIVKHMVEILWFIRLKKCLHTPDSSRLVISNSMRFYDHNNFQNDYLLWQQIGLWLKIIK